ncbi:MAG: HupE/UreJ family protein [Gammaproteobacteria bacterium]
MPSSIQPGMASSSHEKKPADRMRRLLFGILLFACCQAAQAHKSSDSYLTLKVLPDRIDGQWDIALRDLDYAIGLDGNGDARITWGELRSRRNAVADYAYKHLGIDDGGSPCRIRPGQYLVDTHTDGTYSVLQFAVECSPQPRRLGIDYSLLFDLDPQHRGLLRIDYDNAAHTAVLSPANSKQQIELTKYRPGTAFLQYLTEGIRHIWIGYDHILFLLSLLLPAVLVRQQRQWTPRDRFRPVLIEVVKIVTAFTVAHSITLSLAALDVISLPSRWVESAIAASVILAALNNVLPLVSKKLWLLAFVFGLVHGLGFANVLKDLGLPQNTLVTALLAFNLGVEAGQLAIVCGFLPAAFWLKHTLWYRRWVLSGGSAVIALIALAWLLERSVDIKLLGL